MHLREQMCRVGASDVHTELRPGVLVTLRMLINAAAGKGSRAFVVHSMLTVSVPTMLAARQLSRACASRLPFQSLALRLRLG